MRQEKETGTETEIDTRTLGIKMERGKGSRMTTLKTRRVRRSETTQGTEKEATIVIVSASRRGSSPATETVIGIRRGITHAKESGIEIRTETRAERGRGSHSAIVMDLAQATYPLLSERGIVILSRRRRDRLQVADLA